MVYFDYDGNKTNDIDNAKYILLECHADYEFLRTTEYHIRGCKFGIYEIDYQRDLFKYNEFLTNIIGEAQLYGRG